MVTRGPQVRPLPLGIAEFQKLPPIQWGDMHLLWDAWFAFDGSAWHAYYLHRAGVE